MADRHTDHPKTKGVAGKIGGAAQFLASFQGKNNVGRYDDNSLTTAFKKGTGNALKLGKMRRTASVGLLLAPVTLATACFLHEDLTRLRIGQDDTMAPTFAAQAGHQAITVEKYNDDSTYVLLRDAKGEYSVYVDKHKRFRGTMNGGEYQDNKDRAQLTYVESPQEARDIAQRMIAAIEGGNARFAHYTGLSNTFMDPDGIQREGYGRVANSGVKIGLNHINAQAAARWRELVHQINEVGYGIDRADIGLSYSYDPLDDDRKNGSFIGETMDALPETAGFLYGGWLGLGLLGGLGGAAAQAGRNRRQNKPRA